MRPRRSTRVKRYTVEKYDFELESDDEAQTQKTLRDDEGKDGNFDADAAEEAAENEDAGEEEDDDAAEEEEIDDNDDDHDDGGEDPELGSSADEGERFTGPSHEQGEPLRNIDYLDIEPVPPEGQHKGYVGPYERGMRGKALVRAWYGPRPEKIAMAHQLLERWRGWTVLPPKVPHGEHEPTDRAFWSADVVEKESRLAQEWWSRVKPSLTRGDAWVELPLGETHPYQMPLHSMPALMGQHDAQQEVIFEAGCCYPLSHNGLPFDRDGDPEKTTSGWMLDVGGVVLGMDWAPNRHKNPRQLLAMAVIPHSDQDFYNYEEASVNPDFQRHGIVQIWQFLGSEPYEGIVRPSAENALRVRTLCFDYDKVQNPPASLRLSDEYGITATAMTWINCNRIAVGYSDGSIALWSIFPCRLLSRHPVHHNHVVNMASGHPAMPHLIASVPLGGTARLIDIRAPSYEATEVQKPLIHTQPGMLAYSDHMLGFVSTYPSASALNTVVGFLHHRHFPVVRRVFAGDSFINCLAVGRLHPFLLVGAADGSVWSLNAQTEVFSNRHESTEKIRVFQHEHRSAALFPPNTPASARGVSRILQGFAIEKSRNTKNEPKMATKKGGRLRKPRDAPDAAEDDDEVADLTDPSRAVLHEPLTRITAMEWNPNEDYGCWAAVAMGSGLVRVIDLGLDQDSPR
ncbi:hypothetical protein ESCO_002033 [Escovopsis weberi]|uniref:Transcription factor tau subunit sfc6 n=1 Tax=Escovopsis weberi TaxID=150374 RepID=A0A0M8N2J1_ESCWE|nr:hypothetical protein ESCO_002033 [Escovopsis weberi]